MVGVVNLQRGKREREREGKVGERAGRKEVMKRGLPILSLLLYISSSILVASLRLH